MQRKTINAQLGEAAFDFFYRFSRFEFALKENGYLKSTIPGSRAKPGWDRFVKDYADRYAASKEAKHLLSAKPQHQVIHGNGRDLEWVDVDLKDCTTDLERVVRVLKVVRNNLFHGGKHGVNFWDDPKRMQTLLALGVATLGQLATLASIEADYDRLY